MRPFNPGNLLPFFQAGIATEDERWQRHRQLGTDTFPYGLLAPRSRLLPFQLSFEGETGSVTEWSLVSPEDSDVLAVFDVSALEIAGTGTRWWVTWKAEQDLDVVPDCGYCYFRLEVDGESFYSEVMLAETMCGAESAGLELDEGSCVADGGDMTFTINALTSGAASGSTWVIQRSTGFVWATVATNAASHSFVETAASESRNYRIVITSPCGIVTTASYQATWEAGDPCNTLALALVDITTDYVFGTGAGSVLGEPPVWVMTFTAENDKANVLYQNGYVQKLYLRLLVWDRPEVEREIERRVNGRGVETKRFTRTVERRGFETPSLPDYVTGFLTKAGDLTVTLTELKTVEENSIENLTFEARPQGATLNIGRFYFECEAEAFQGCQENFVLE